MIKIINLTYKGFPKHIPATQSCIIIIQPKMLTKCQPAPPTATGPRSTNMANIGSFCFKTPTPSNPIMHESAQKVL